MARWQFNGPEAELDYPALGFIAELNDILIATAAPDGRWMLADNQSAAETVERYTIGGDPGYVSPGDGNVLVWSDDANAYVPTDPTGVFDDTFVRTVNSQSPDAAGNLDITAADLDAVDSAALQTAIDDLVAAAPGALDTLNELAAALGDDPNFATTMMNLLAEKAPLASPTFTGTVSGVTKAMVGLGNVDNTADADKPISTAQQTALDAKADTTRTVNSQTGTTYTLVLADAGAFVTMDNGGASTLTVPPNSSVAFPVGTVVEGAQLGAGQVTLTAGTGVTINATPSLQVAERYGSFALIKLTTDTWLAIGRLADI